MCTAIKLTSLSKREFISRAIKYEPLCVIPVLRKYIRESGANSFTRIIRIRKWRREFIYFCFC